MTDQDNTITGLRGELFATIRALRDPTNPMDVNRAKAVAEVAGRIIESAKAETEAVKAFGRGAVPVSGFIGAAPKPDTLDTQGAERPQLPKPDPQRGTHHSMPSKSPMGVI